MLCVEQRPRSAVVYANPNEKIEKRGREARASELYASKLMGAGREWVGVSAGRQTIGERE
eukprot:1142400-Pyramimonas_sp.AAC.1